MRSVTATATWSTARPRSHARVVGKSTGARSRTLSGGFGGRLLSREHTGKRPTGTTAHRGGAPPVERNSRIQFHVPIRFADEASPTVDPHVAGRVQRPPYRPHGLLAQRHPSLLRRPVGLPLVAADARQHAVLPS